MEERTLPELYPGWKTVRKIGSGSFGAVYEIERDLFGKTERAALKHICIPQSESDVDEMYSNGYDSNSITAYFETFLADIVREYSLMAEMKGHTNVVYCDDIRYTPREDGVGWDVTIKMELLTPLLRTLGPEFSEEQVIRLGRDLCRALVLCKSRDIVHRDIKPQNIFVSRTGDYKLGDFGIAKTVEKTSGGTKIGTYSYMAPEIYHSQPYGSSADIYSLGLVMYWLMNQRRLPFLPLTKKPPTYEETEIARHRRFMGEALLAPKNGSRQLQQIVLKACAFRPEDRFASAQEMLDALDGLGQTAPVVNKVVVQEAVQESIAATQKELDHTQGIWGQYNATQILPENPPAPVVEERPIPEIKAADPVQVTNEPIKKEKKSPKRKVVWAAAILAVVLAVFVAVIGIGGAGSAQKCGDHLKWSISEDGTLTISGRGSMYDYISGRSDYLGIGCAPWSDQVNRIKKIVICEGVTTIGNYAFYGCSQVKQVEMAKSLTSIGKYAFFDCDLLKRIAVPAKVTKIDCGAFSSCKSLSAIYIYSDRCEIYTVPTLNTPQTTTIYGYLSSTAQVYASKYGHPFILLGN